ncbi:MAG: hypothetical protein AAF500_03210 [Myxococcota bacterium]
MRWRARTWLLVALVSAGLAAVSGCATTGTLENSVYKSPETTYQVGPRGPGWTRLAVNDQNDLAFHNAAKEAVMHVDSRCDPSLDIPLTALRAHLMIGFTDRDVISEQTVPMDGREALRTHFTAKLDGVEREIVMQILKKDGCVYDFALITPPGPAFEDAVDDFDGFVDGFNTISEKS